MNRRVNQRMTHLNQKRPRKKLMAPAVNVKQGFLTALARVSGWRDLTLKKMFDASPDMPTEVVPGEPNKRLSLFHS